MNSLPLPSNIEAEKCVLGAVLLAPAKVEALLTGLSSDDMQLPAHREICDAMGVLHGRGHPIDVVSLGSELRARGVELRLEGGEGYLLELASATPTAENLGHYMSLVRKASTHRQIALAASAAVDAVRAQEEPEAILERTAERLAAIAVRRSDKLVTIGEVMPAVLAEIERRASNPESTQGLRYGVQKLDYLTGGARAGQLIIIAADTGFGKTSLEMQLVIESSTTQSAQWFVVNCEMTKLELAERALAYHAKLDSHFLRAGSLSYDSWRQAMASGAALSRLPVYLEDSLFDINDIVSRARAWRAKCPGTAAGIAVDYLQLVSGQQGAKRNEEVAGVARRLKRLAGELEVPVILLSQLNRDGKKAERPPSKHDLRDSGTIEDDANVIILGHCLEPAGSAVGDKVMGNLIVDKQRNGPTGVAPVDFIGKHYRFVDRDESMEGLE
jgi:replicative DNA helicase